MKYNINLLIVLLISMTLSNCGGVGGGEIGAATNNSIDSPDFSDNESDGTTQTNDSGAESNVTKDLLFSQKLITGFSTGGNGMEPFVIERDGTIKATININKDARSSSPQLLLQDGNRVFYTTMTNHRLTSLWTSDGTNIGTHLVKIFQLGESQYVGYSAVMIENILYFYTFNNNREYILWRTDSTQEGTFAIKTFKSIRHLLNYNNTLYFIVRNSDWTYSLYNSDGTAEGTNEYKHLSSNYIKDIVEYKSKIYYSHSGGLYAIDTSTDSIEKIYTINASGSLHIMGDKLFFTPYSSTPGLYISDGTTNGTNKISNIPVKENTHDVNQLVIGDILYFVGITDDEGEELWRSDGTVEGTYMVKDIHIGPGNARPRNFTNVKGRLYFYITDEKNGYRTYSTDGSSEGTRFESSYSGSNFITYKGSVAMLSTEPRRNLVLLENNSTVHLTKNSLLPKPYSEPSLIKIDDKLLFNNQDLEHGEELWVSDGTTEGTEFLVDLDSGNNDSISYPNYVNLTTDRNIKYMKGSYYFVTISSSSQGNQLWKSDGTVNGTNYIQTLNERSTENVRLESMNSILYYNAFSEENGSALWRNDGTTSGTYMLKDINPSTKNGGAGWLTAVDHQLFFTADDGIHGVELYVTDGTVIGTHMLKDIQEGSISSRPFDLTPFHSEIYFEADDGINGKCLYKSNGTKEGTVLVKDFFINDTNPSMEYLTASGNYLYFIAKVSPSSPTRKLYRTDGTTVGTIVVKDIQSGASYNTLRALTDVNGTLYLSGNGALWKSDGTEEGTQVVKEDFNFGFPTAVGNALFFLSTDKEHGNELWKSDGTEKGTYMVKDIYPGIRGSSIRIRRSFENKLIFSAFNGKSTNLYVSDGTEDGTHILKIKE